MTRRDLFKTAAVLGVASVRAQSRIPIPPAGPTVAASTPMQWPTTWKHPSALRLLHGTAIDCLLVGAGDEFAPVRAQALKSGLHVVGPDAPPVGIRVVKGQWPGVKMGRAAGQASAGPTARGRHSRHHPNWADDGACRGPQWRRYPGVSVIDLAETVD